MFYESLVILNISTLNFSEGVPASVLDLTMAIETIKTLEAVLGLPAK